MRSTRYECTHLAWAAVWVFSVLLLAFAASLAPASKRGAVGFGAAPAFAACDTCGTGSGAGTDHDHDPTGPDRP